MTQQTASTTGTRSPSPRCVCFNEPPDDCDNRSRYDWEYEMIGMVPVMKVVVIETTNVLIVAENDSLLLGVATIIPIQRPRTDVASTIGIAPAQCLHTDVVSMRGRIIPEVPAWSRSFEPRSQDRGSWGQFGIRGRGRPSHRGDQNPRQNTDSTEERCSECGWENTNTRMSTNQSGRSCLRKARTFSKSVRYG